MWKGETWYRYKPQNQKSVIWATAIFWKLRGAPWFSNHRHYGLYLQRLHWWIIFVFTSFPRVSHRCLLRKPVYNGRPLSRSLHHKVPPEAQGTVWWGSSVNEMFKFAGLYSLYMTCNFVLFLYFRRGYYISETSSCATSSVGWNQLPIHGTLCKSQDAPWVSRI